jgi:hypothetical protein
MPAGTLMSAASIRRGADPRGRSVRMPVGQDEPRASQRRASAESPLSVQRTDTASDFPAT